MADQENHKKTVTDYRKDYEYYTGKASDINRNLALGGIAVIWIFKTTTNGNISIPDQLILPLFCLVISLSLDLLQYIVGGLIWCIYFKYKECQVHNGSIGLEDDIEAPNILPIIIHIFYWSKIVATIIGYYLLSTFLYAKFFEQTAS